MFDVGDSENAAPANHSGKAGRFHIWSMWRWDDHLVDRVVGLGRVPDIVSNKILGDSASGGMSTSPRLCVGISMGSLI